MKIKSIVSVAVASAVALCAASAFAQYPANYNLQVNTGTLQSSDVYCASSGTLYYEEAPITGTGHPFTGGRNLSCQVSGAPNFVKNYKGFTILSCSQSQGPMATFGSAQEVGFACVTNSK